MTTARTLALSIFSIALLWGALIQSAERRTNIVIVMADDLGYGDLSCYGATKINTSHCDRLARQGRRFTDAHTPSAVCSPTRFGLLTGCYPWRDHRVPRHLLASEPLVIDPHGWTIASLLKQAGYATACFGKWHLGAQRNDPIDWNQPLRPGPNDVGFDEYYGVINSHNQAPYVWVKNDKIVGMLPDERIVVEGNQREVQGIANRRVNNTIGPTLAAKAVSFIQRNRDRPFFLYLPTCAVHLPITPAPAMRGKSKVGAYGDFVVEFDYVVGRLLEALDRFELSDDTLVVVTSDNGAINSLGAKFSHRSNGSLRGQKAGIYEGGHRVPFIVRWPGRVPADTECDETISLVDLMATVCAATDTVLPDDAGPDSYNLLPAMLDEDYQRPLREATISVSKFLLHYSIRQGPWKLITLGDAVGVAPTASYVETQRSRFGPTEPELYHLDRDPGETNNVYADHPKVVERLTQIHQRYVSQGRSRP